MATHQFKFKTAAEAQAFELGALFYWSHPPYSTDLNGAALTVKSDFGCEHHDHVWRWEGLSADPVDVGTNPLISIVHFPTIPEARAFAGGLDWFCGAFVSIGVSGSTVTVEERRESGDGSGALEYSPATLRGLIDNHRQSLTENERKR